MADEVGSISTIAVILAAKGISIKNIGINNNRERGEGALKIAFYNETSMKEAWERLEKYKFDLVLAVEKSVPHGKGIDTNPMTG